MEKLRNFMGKFMEYMIITWANKLVALLLLFIGLVPILMDHDGTVALFTTFAAIPFLLAKENIVKSIEV